MKQLLTSIACVTLLMAFVAQFAQNQLLFQQFAEVNYVLNVFEKNLCEEGELSLECQTWLKKEIQRIMDCPIDAVIVEAVSKVKDNKEILAYKVTIPVSEILAVPEFWGISESENQTAYVVSREIEKREN